MRTLRLPLALGLIAIGLVLLSVCTSLGSQALGGAPRPATAAPAAAASPEATATASATASPAPTATTTPTPSPTPGPPPRVIASYPVHRDWAVRPELPLVLVFDQPMDAASVAASLVISPAVEVTIQAQAPERIVVSPLGGWPAQDYVLRLDGARNSKGQPLASPFVLEFGLGGPGVHLPILMYHHLQDLGPEATAVQRTWTVSPSAFAAQMEYLAANGWQTITPAQLAAYLAAGEPLPPHATMITLDDGYREVYDVARPVFERTGLRPVLFIVPEYLGYGAYLSAEQLQELAQEGYTIGAHGYDHSLLRELSDEELPHQMADARAVLQEVAGVPVDAYCYPSGSFDQRSIQALSTHGYTTGFTLNGVPYQLPDEPYLLNRLLIDYETTLDAFRELVQ